MQSVSLIEGENSKDDVIQRLSAHLLERLEYCANHKRVNYSEDWETYDRMVAGAYKNFYDVNDENESWRSEAYYNICEQKRRSAIAQIGDAVTNGGKFPFMLKETPEGETESEINKALKAIGIDMNRAMDDMERKIHDHLEESKSFIELRRSIDDCSKYGVGIFKSPHLYMDKARKISLTAMQNMPEIPNENGVILPEGEQIRDEWLKNEVLPQMKLEDVERIGLRRIKPSDFFPDPSCEGDAQKGFGHFERNHYSSATLRKMADEVITLDDGQELPKYNKDAILATLQRHYANANDGRNNNDQNGATEEQRHDIESDDTNFRGIPVYTFYGDVLRREVSGALSRPEIEGETEGDLSDYDTISIICDITREGDVLRVIENPHPSGKRPIHIWQWEQVSGEWVGKGICQKLRDLQEEFNRFLRYWIDNKLMSSSVILGVMTSKIDRSENENMKLYPNKTFYLRDGDNIRDMIQQFNIADVSGPFLEGMYRLMEMIDHESGVPRIIEGQGSADAKTAFETQQQEAHALKQLGMVIKNMDEAIVVGLEMVYQYLLVYGDGTGAVIGDFKVSAKGYSSFEDKRLKLMELDRMLQMTTVPSLAIHINERNVLEDKYEILGIDKERYLRSMEEVQATQAQQAEMQQKQVQMAMEAAMQEKMADAEAKIAVEQAKAQLKAGEIQVEVAEKEKDRDHEIKRDLIKIEADENKGVMNGQPRI